ncbi:MAG TPA: flagellar biosynthetic protein FliR, partial [Firmicutes bacterium]|nr:flagellar biosynthetic protein FliR [Bacillota bacterium]
MEVILTDFVRFALALVRLATFLAVIPVFNMRNIPIQAKIGLAALAALVVMPPLAGNLNLESPGVLMFLALQEVAAGLLLALVVILVFAIITFAGHYVDTPMGFGMASVFDPSLGGQIPVFSQFYFVFATLIFFGVDAHLWLFKALTKSFAILPLGQSLNLEPSFPVFMDLIQQVFVLGIKLALPIVATILLTDLGLGIVIRAVPQINVFVIGFPIKIAVGLLVIVFALPTFVLIVSELFSLDGLLFRYFHEI